ncbi:MAG TPA: polyprenyl synthetase family protein [bacterium]|nr:polyprenyl synthetase family protein [bacterium]
MKKYLAASKERTAAYLGRFLADKETELAPIGPRAAAVARDIHEFCTRGKMIRAAMTLLGWEAAGGKPGDAVIPVAAAMEMIHAGLLIHDDVMDRDDFRRGKPAFHRRYADALTDEAKEPRHTGEALAICAGDVAFFLAAESVMTAAIPEPHGAAMRRTFFRECVLVGIGQMDDVYLGARLAPVTVADILPVYRYKTARYTFSMPLILGAIAAGGDAKVRDGLDAVGEKIGTLFQIKDDELGLFGEEADIGKPTGSDIREGKKTILFSLLADMARGADKERLSRTLGNPDIGPDDIAFVRTLAEKSGALGKVRAQAADIDGEARTLIAALTVGDEVKRLLNELIDYNRDRGF